MTDVESRIAAVVERTRARTPAPPSIDEVRRGAAHRQRRHRLAGAAAVIAIVGGGLSGMLLLRTPTLTVTAGPAEGAAEPWMILPTETLGLPLQVLTVEGSDIPPDGSNQQVFAAGPDGPLLVANVHPGTQGSSPGEIVERGSRTFGVVDMSSVLRANTTISWQSPDGFAFLRFSGLGRDAALDLAEDLELRTGKVAGIDPTSLPAGWTSESDEPVAYSRSIRGAWGAGIDGERGLDFSAGASLWGDFATQLGNSNTVDVSGVTGILAALPSGLTVSWYVDGVIAELHGVGVTESELLAIARSVRPITEAQRQQLSTPVAVTAATATTASGSTDDGPLAVGPRIEMGRLDDLPVGSIRVKGGIAVARTDETTVVGFTLVDHPSSRFCTFTALVADGVVTTPGEPVFRTACGPATFGLDGSCLEGCFAGMPLVIVENRDGDLFVRPAPTGERAGDERVAVGRLPRGPERQFAQPDDPARRQQPNCHTPHG